MVSISDLLSGPLSGKASVVAGAQSLNHIVTWVASARSRTPALSRLEGGELVLIPPSAYEYLGGDQTLEDLLRSLKSADIAGICLWQVPSVRAIQVANEIELPILAVTNVSPPELERDLVEFISNRIRSGIQRTNQTQVQLLDILASNRGPEALIRLLAQSLNMPVACYQIDGQMISSPNFPDIDPPDLNTDWKESTIYTNRSTDARYSGWIWQIAVRRSNKPIAVLVVLADKPDPTPQEALDIKQTAAAISVELSRLLAAEENKARLRSELIRDLFYKGSVENLAVRADVVGVSIPNNGIVAVIRGIPPETNAMELLRDLLPRVSSLLSSYPILYEKGEIAMLLPANLRGESTTSMLSRGGTINVPNIAIGISSQVKQISEIPNHLYEARVAALVSEKVYQGRMVTLEEAKAYGLIAPLAGLAPIKRRVIDILTPLITEAEGNRSELFETLKVYSECNGNLSEAARILHIHRNSLAYRLHKIEQLTGRNLDDPEDRFMLAIAVHLYPFLV